MGGRTQAFRGCGIQRQLQRGVLNEIAQMRVFIVANRRFHGDRLFGDFQHLADLVFRHQHAFGQFFRGRLTAHFLQHLTGNTVEFVDGLNHMHRNTYGARLIRNGTSDCLPNPPGGVSGELVATTVFELIYRFHQANVAFLNQIQELKAAVGVFLGNRNNQTQVGFHHLFLGATRFGFTNRHTAVDVFHLFDSQAGFFLDLLQFQQAAFNVVGDFTQFFRPGFTHRQRSFEPLDASFVAGEHRHEVFLRHFALLNAQLHDQTFLRADTIHHGAHAVDQQIELFRYQTELFEDFGQLVDLVDRGLMAAAMRLNAQTSRFVLFTQFGEFLAGQLRIDAVIVIAIGIVAVFFFVFFFVFNLFAFQFSAFRRCGGQILFRIGIDKAGDEIG